MNFHLIREFIGYLTKAKGTKWLHSPWNLDVYQKAILDDELPLELGDVEKIRATLLKSKRVIDVHDLGAGSQRMKKTTRKVSEITQYATASPRKAALFFRLLRYFSAQTTLELGTSLGLTTLYLALANAEGNVYSLEGCPQTLALAKENFSRLKQSNIRVSEGDISKTLVEVLDQLPQIDFLLLDANHRYEPTLTYFEQCLPKLHRDSVVVVDDIHWSSEMTRAWHKLRQHKEVSTSIDLFEVGLLFFHQRHPQQHFTLYWPPRLQRIFWFL